MIVRFSCLLHPHDRAAPPIQWMTAGKGIVHGENFPLVNDKGDNFNQFFQIWLNLPSKNKMVDPHFTMHWAPDIPKVKVPPSSPPSRSIVSAKPPRQPHQASNQLQQQQREQPPLGLAFFQPCPCLVFFFFFFFFFFFVSCAACLHLFATFIGHPPPSPHQSFPWRFFR